MPKKAPFGERRLFEFAVYPARRLSPIRLLLAELLSNDGS